MSVLASDLAGYLALRRALGYKLVDDGRQLAQFVAYLDAATQRRSPLQRRSAGRPAPDAPATERDG